MKPEQTKLKYSTERRQEIVEMIENSQRITTNIVQVLKKQLSDPFDIQKQYLREAKIEKLICELSVENTEIKLLKIESFNFSV